METYELIVVIIKRGKADKLIDWAFKAGAQGATIFFARGRGWGEKFGFLSKLVWAEKEIIFIISKKEDTEKIFNTLVEKGNLNNPKVGIAFVVQINKVVGYFEYLKRLRE